MTRSVQPSPTSPRAESGSGGEEAAVTAAAVTEPQPEVEPDSSEAKTGAQATGTQAEETAAEAESAAEGRTTTEPEADTGPETGAAPDSRSESESASEADPGAAAAAKSRLPALVRTMTATAIDRPRQQTGHVGRPGKAVLAGAAVAGALLVSVPFLVFTGGDDKGSKVAPAGGTVLGGDEQEAPGDFVATKPDTGAQADGEKNSSKPDKPAQKAPAGSGAQESGKDTPKQDTGQKDTSGADAGRQGQPAKSGGDQASGGGNDQPANPGSGVTFSAPVSLRSHLSGRCIDVPNADFGDGKKLFVWDCNNGVAQKWQFASDGTMRIGGLCLDVANANYSDGSPIQIARCSGNAAQKFVLNERHDLVNTVVGKCVDIKDNNTGNGAWLQLWTCAGTDNQKWSV